MIDLSKVRDHRPRKGPHKWAPSDKSGSERARAAWQDLRRRAIKYRLLERLADGKPPAESSGGVALADYSACMALGLHRPFAEMYTLKVTADREATVYVDRHGRATRRMSWTTATSFRRYMEARSVDAARWLKGGRLP